MPKKSALATKPANAQAAHNFVIDAEEIVRWQLRYIGEDPKREGLVDTPKRVVAAWGELFGGYKIDPSELLKAQFDSDGYDQMIVSRNIDFYSTCEHHMLPFSGVAHIGYIPNKKLLGLSKLSRLVECYARRLQIQERITQQIANVLEGGLEPIGAGVMLVAHHFCVGCRGVKKQHNEMVTTCLKGRFLAQAVREEFLAQLTKV